MTDKQLLEQCKAWFSDIMDISGQLTTGNVAHKRSMISGYARGCVEFINEYLKEQ